MNIAFSVLIIVGAIVVSRAIQWPFKHLTESEKSGKIGGSIFVNIFRVLIYGWAICALVDLWFNVDMVGLVGALGVVGVAVSLGAQQTIANVIGGVIVSLSQMVGKEDWITVQGKTEARVVDTNWRRTTLEDENGIQHVVPNAFMVSNIIEKGNPYFTIIVPFSLKTTVPDVRGLLVDCEQVILDAQIAGGLDYEAMRPKAYVQGASFGAIQAELKLFANRSYDSRHVKRAVLPALIELLQKRNALADIRLADADAADVAEAANAAAEIAEIA